MYLYIRYGLLYGRTYLPFLLLPTEHVAETDTRTLVKPLSLDRQAHPCLLTYAVVTQTRDARDVARL